MSTQTKEPVFQFPLALLAVERECGPALQKIVDFCLVNVAENLADGDRVELEHLERARKMLDVSVPNPGGTLAAGKKLRSQYLGGTRDAWVRVKANWLWGCHNDGAPTWPEFRVLCGIYSVIGEKPFARVSAESLRFRSAGARSKAVYDPNRDHDLLGEKEVRLITDRLELRGFFARFCYRRRITFFSNKLGRDDLAKLALAYCEGNRARLAEMRKQDAIKSGMAEGRTEGEQRANIISGAT